jgi:hypothetical protein
MHAEKPSPIFSKHRINMKYLKMANTERKIAQVLPWQHDIFKFSIFFIFFVQNGKLIERLGLLAIQQWISEIYTVGVLFCFLCVFI